MVPQMRLLSRETTEAIVYTEERRKDSFLPREVERLKAALLIPAFPHKRKRLREPLINPNLFPIGGTFGFLF